MGEHTKGPWRIAYTDGSGPEYITANDVSLVTLRWGCSCCKNTITEFSELSAEEQANARLIAAAPDLLDACKRLLEVEPPRLTTGEERETFRLALAAIAKAEGSLTRRERGDA
jgi:hypothetical protein